MLYSWGFESYDGSCNWIYCRVDGLNHMMVDATECCIVEGLNHMMVDATESYAV